MMTISGVQSLHREDQQAVSNTRSQGIGMNTTFRLCTRPDVQLSSGPVLDVLINPVKNGLYGKSECLA